MTGRLLGLITFFLHKGKKILLSIVLKSLCKHLQVLSYLEPRSILLEEFIVSEIYLKPLPL